MKALIADDEPLLRERLRSHLARLWPELEIAAEALGGIDVLVNNASGFGMGDDEEG